MNFDDLTGGSESNTGACIWPMRDSRGKTVMCSEITLLDGDGNHYALCSEHRKLAEEAWRAMKSGQLKSHGKMKINKLVMR